MKIVVFFSFLSFAIFGAYLLFTPMEKLVAEASNWVNLPEEGTRARTLICWFWRGLGAFFCLAAMASAVSS
jgi:hypothetical protein